MKSITIEGNLLTRLNLMLQMQFTLKLDNPDVGREGCIAGVTGRDTTSCKVGNIWGVFILSSFDIFDVNI